jgi:hypothetical protein
MRHRIRLCNCEQLAQGEATAVVRLEFGHFLTQAVLGAVLRAVLAPAVSLSLMAYVLAEVSLPVPVKNYLYSKCTAQPPVTHHYAY